MYKRWVGLTRALRRCVAVSESSRDSASVFVSSRAISGLYTLMFSRASSQKSCAHQQSGARANTREADSWGLMHGSPRGVPVLAKLSLRQSRCCLAERCECAVLEGRARVQGCRWSVRAGVQSRSAQRAGVAAQCTNGTCSCDVTPGVRRSIVESLSMVLWRGLSRPLILAGVGVVLHG